MDQDIKIYKVELYNIELNDSDLMEYAKEMPEASIEKPWRLEIFESFEYPVCGKERNYKLKQREYQLFCPEKYNKVVMFRGTIYRREILSGSGELCDCKTKIYVVKKEQNFYELGTGIPVHIINFKKDIINDPVQGSHWFGEYYCSNANTFGIIKSTCDLTNRKDLEDIDDYLNWVEKNKKAVSESCNKANPNVSLATRPYAKLKKIYEEQRKIKMEEEAKLSSKKQRILSYVSKIK